MSGAEWFTCPKCGGHWFGTLNPGTMDTEGQQVYCRDQWGKRCRWTGPISAALPTTPEDRTDAG